MTSRAVAFSLFLAGCAPAPEPTADTCGPDDETVLGACALDECAAGCTDVVTAAACCVAAHGRGGFSTFDADALASQCAGSSCDQDLYLSADSAVCIAQVTGLSPGYGTCRAFFTFLGDEPIWAVMNATSEDGASGDIWKLDAISGALIYVDHAEVYARL